MTTETTHDKDKIIAAAKECGAYRYINRAAKDEPTHTFTVDQLERFYAIAFEAGRKDEREECASILSLTDISALPDQLKGWIANMLNCYAEVIRARGDTK